MIVTQEEIIRTNPLRYYLRVDIEDNRCQIGLNEHYVFDTPIKDAVKDFVDYVKKELEKEGSSYTVK